jgi:hypothetical protein
LNFLEQRKAASHGFFFADWMLPKPAGCATARGACVSVSIIY